MESIASHQDTPISQLNVPPERDVFTRMLIRELLSADIFLADVGMSGPNGIEAAKHIRSLCPKTRIICFSGHAATSNLLDVARKQGHEFEFLAEPIKPDVLVKAIREPAT